MTPTITYTDILERLRAHDILVEANGAPTGPLSGRVQEDSRHVTEGDTFVAITGTRHDGLQHVPAAQNQGAAVVVAQTAPPGGTPGPWIQVTDARRALVELVSLSFHDPGSRLRIAAVTGTNGKTTTATLVAGTLNALGYRVGFVGTTGYRFDGQVAEASHTTPSCVRLHSMLHTWQGRGCTHAALEASSHALDQHRLRPADVDVAVFTNLTRDHLDYHGSEEQYLRAKKRLFDGLSSSSWAIVNAADAASSHITADCRAQIVRVGIDIPWEIKASRLDGLDLMIDGRACHTRLPGRFNAFNTVLTYGALTAFGVSSTDAIGALETADPAPGRFETLRLKGDLTAIIDYAHTPDALAQILDAVRDVTGSERRLWVVFGCGGDRDRGKRPLMGRVAEERADRVVVTSDNPRHEDPEAILDDVLSGMQHPDRALREVDRTSAIEEAVRRMSAGDVLVVAGKGHETVQVVGDLSIPLDDRHILEGA